MKNLVKWVGVVVIGLGGGPLAMADEVSAAAEDCLYARDVRSVEILSEDMLLMHGSANRLWLNRLATQCSGMDDKMILEFSRYGSQMCRTDRVEARERGGSFGFTSSCRLGSFEPVAAEQVQALRRSLEEQS